jgi:hypothetical protein
MPHSLLSVPAEIFCQTFAVRRADLEIFFSILVKSFRTNHPAFNGTAQSIQFIILWLSFTDTALSPLSSLKLFASAVLIGASNNK